MLAGFSFGFSESTAGSRLGIAHAVNQLTEQVNIAPQEFPSCATDGTGANPTNDDTRKITHGFI
jgi:hypothetical protein